MTLLFDTSALSDLLSAKEHAVKAFSEQSYDELLVPLATDAELRFGFANGTRTADNLKTYELFKQQFHASVKHPDQDTAIIYADLAAYARKNGLALSHNDFWIAATTIQHGGVLLTSDGDFKALPQIRALVLIRE
jgi:predicted nucleic acid-binding protein